MEIEKIFEEWNKDCKIDRSQLDVESLNTPSLHNKYLKMYAIERVQLKKQRVEYNKTKRQLIKYYRGEADRVDLQEMGNKSQFLGKAMGKEFEMLVETDELLEKQVLKVAVQEEKVEFLKSVIAEINRRSFEIKNAIEFIKWTQGA